MIAGQITTVSTPSAMKLIQKSFGRHPVLREIAGDASTRRFFRVSSGRKTAVLVVHPEPLTPDAPLYSNHRVLTDIGVPVPRIIARDNRSGSVLFEDLGDTTMQKYLAGPRGRPVATWRRIYRQASDLIALLQHRGAAALRPADFARRNALDRERFVFELGHFHRHYIRGLRGRAPGPADEAMLRAFYDDLATVCAGQPRVYCHRDFQSRNLMVVSGRLRLIDFQDARMGPYTYDAASLLRDSSLDIDEVLVEEMLDYLCGTIGAAPEEFRNDFARMALQRNIKDLGTFGYMATVRGLRSYLDHVPRTLRSVQAGLLKSSRYHYFHPVIERYVLS